MRVREERGEMMLYLVAFLPVVHAVVAHRSGVIKAAMAAERTGCTFDVLASLVQVVGPASNTNKN